MDAERWQRVKQILQEAWEWDPAERSAFLDQACGHDPELRSSVEHLLASDENISKFLATPVHDEFLQAIASQESKYKSQAPGQRIGRYSSSESDTLEEGRFPPGFVIGGRYRVLALLGRGGMGEVYRAQDLVLNQIVALKFLSDAIRTKESALARFRNEVRIARQISHPNVCRVYDIGIMEGLHFLSMEYIDGEDLSSLIRRIGRLPQDKALDISRRICAGVAAAHDRGVLHRDLKPANIMIDGRGHVRIT